MFKRSFPKKSLFLTVAVLAFIALVAFGGFYFKKFRDVNGQNTQLRKQLDDTSKELQAFKADPSQASQAEANRIIGEVGKLYALPKDEQPSVATVTDVSKLKDQQFFAKAQNGDVTLIYSTAKLAILYRPSSNQIVNVSSVTIQDQQQPTPSPTTTP